MNPKSTTDQLAIKFLKTIEKASGVKILDTQAYNTYSNYTLNLKPHDDYASILNNNSGDKVTHITLTQEQFQSLTEDLKPLAGRAY